VCFACWEEDHGAPKDLPDGAEATVDLIQELYSREDGERGALLRVALYDYHLDDADVIPFDLAKRHHTPPWKYRAQYSARTVELCQQISTRLLAMSKAQRAAVVAKAHGWF